MSLKGKTLFAAVAAPVLVGLAGCGGSVSNNDQGTVFLAFGYFTDTTGTTGLASESAPLSTDIGSAPGLGSAEVIATMGVENRLRNQFIRVTKIDCDYDVPGAKISIPSDAILANGVAEPNPAIGGPAIDGAGGSGDVGFGASGGGSGSGSTSSGTASAGSTGGSSGGTSSATGGSGVSGPATGQGGRAFIEFPIVGPDIFAYLNNNREGLPTLPFRMDANCRATGVSSAGDVFATNDLGFTVTFFEEIDFPNPGATGATGGSGGDVTGFGGDDTANSGTSTTVDTGSSSGSGT